MSVKALTRLSGLSLLIGSILAFAGERMSYDYAQPTQNAFQSVFYLALILGVLLLGIALVRVRVLPLGIGILFIIAALVKIPDIALPPLTLFSDLFFVIALFAGFGWTGYWLVSQPSAREQPEVARA
jgi:hypothetical protein